MRSDLECSIPALDKHECCKNTEGSNHMQLIMCRFCPCCVKFCRFCLLNIGPEHSRSNLVFEMHNSSIFGMLYSFCNVMRKKPRHITVNLVHTCLKTYFLLSLTHWMFLISLPASFLTGEAKPPKSLVVGQSGVSKICEQTSVSSKRV